MSETLLLVAPLVILLAIVLFAFTGCSSFTAGPDAPVDSYETVVAKTPGFTGHWRLNETGGNIAVVSGSLAPAGNGTYSVAGVKLGQPGALSKKDAKDFAPVLDGSQGFVEVPYDARLNPDNALKFSVELWVKPNPGAGAATQVVISSHHITPAATARGYEIALVRVPGETHARVRGRVYSSTVATPSEVVVAPNQGDPAAWRHIVMTYDGTGGATGKKLTLFVNVVGTTSPFIAEISGSAYQNVQTDKSTLRFGAGHQAAGGAVNFFAGSLDEVAFYNIAIAKADVETHFKMSQP